MSKKRRKVKIGFVTPLDPCALGLYLANAILFRLEHSPRLVRLSE